MNVYRVCITAAAAECGILLQNRVHGWSVQDDPFSALDLPTGAHIFEDGILHFCLMKRKRTVVVVTHELHFLPFAHAVSGDFWHLLCVRAPRLYCTRIHLLISALCKSFAGRSVYSQKASRGWH